MVWRGPVLAMFAAGYGANHFTPLLIVYRRALALSDVQVTAVFGVYALGLIPAVLLAGPASDRHGRRPLMITFAAVSLGATAVMITGLSSPAGLYVGRFLTGVVSGVVFSVGTAWVKELAAGTSIRSPARVAALAMTAGFGAGPLVGGALAQWAPAPEVLPYAVHLLLALGALVLLAPVPETVRHPAVVAVPGRGHPRFARVVAPLAPWVFGSITLAFTTLPARGVTSLGDAKVIFSGLLAALALGAGLAIQPLGRRLQKAALAGSGPGTWAHGLSLVVLGYGVAAFTAERPGLAQTVTASVLLGAGYGLCLVWGLTEVERLAAPAELGGLVARFYALSYAGLAVPYLTSLVAGGLGYPVALLLVALAAGLTAALVAVRSRRNPATERPPDRP